MFHALRSHILCFLLCAILSWLSIAEAPVAIPPGNRLPSCNTPEPPAGGENPTLPA